jgi:hypothetical protein
MYVVLTYVSSWGWRTKERREIRYSCLFIYARGARQVTCADGQSSHISLLSKYGEIAARKWHLEMAWFRRLEMAGVAWIRYIVGKNYNS